MEVFYWSEYKYLATYLNRKEVMEMATAKKKGAQNQPAPATQGNCGCSCGCAPIVKK
jgi:hypothetical protein